MLVKSLIAVLLSIPATVGLIGMCLAMLPKADALTFPILLLVFPVWVGLACACYLLPSTGAMAGVFCAITGLCFGIIYALKAIWLSGV